MKLYAPVMSVFAACGAVSQTLAPCPSCHRDLYPLRHAAGFDLFPQIVSERNMMRRCVTRGRNCCRSGHCSLCCFGSSTIARMASSTPRLRLSWRGNWQRRWSRKRPS